ncbi:MAG TPA: glycoside hydrolase family 2 protein, partial [Acidobacteriaceae bacterium]|nr:glycoside hydrolase family 2 protein [Acidobacteriaceae bacterium]
NDKWGRSFTFVVNGIPIFAKGANVIPLDSFPARVTEDQMRTLLASARDANMNMLRVWGGGYYETDRFYELCDQMGLMVWQEFMFGGGIYPHNAAFLESVQQEAIDQVKRLRNYASLVLWCGNNESELGWFSWANRAEFKAKLPKDVQQNIWGGYMHLFSGILPQVVALYSPETAYWPSSPSNNFTAAEGNDQYGDQHSWAVWHGQAPFKSYEDQYPRFMSEYGFQSFPSMTTIDSFTLPEDRALLSKVMLSHQKNKEGNQLIKIYMDREFPTPKDFPSFVYVSQVLQAQGIQLGAEHLRRNRGHVMGSLYWQLNDCWPVASWSSVDYYNRWKALQYYAKRFYNDVLVSPHTRNGDVAIAVVSDRLQPFDATVHAYVMDFSGKVLVDKQWPVHVAPLSAQEVWRESQSQLLANIDPSTVFLHTDIVANGANGETLSTNDLYFLPYKDLHLPAAQLQVQWTQVDGAPAVKVSSATLARDVDLDFGSLNVQPADNFFDLLPGKPVTITLRTKESATALQQALHVMSLTDAFGPAAAGSSAASSVSSASEKASE